MFGKIESLIELGNFELSVADAENYCDPGADNYDGYS